MRKPDGDSRCWAPAMTGMRGANQRAARRPADHSTQQGSTTRQSLEHEIYELCTFICSANICGALFAPSGLHGPFLPQNPAHVIYATPHRTGQGHPSSVMILSEPPNTPPLVAYGFECLVNFNVYLSVVLQHNRRRSRGRRASLSDPVW